MWLWCNLPFLIFLDTVDRIFAMALKFTCVKNNYQYSYNKRDVKESPLKTIVQCTQQHDDVSLALVTFVLHVFFLCLLLCAAVGHSLYYY